MNDGNPAGIVGVGQMPRARVREHWRELIGLQQRSGLGVGEFCRQRSITPASFYRWRSKLSVDAQAQGGFVAVRLRGGAKQERGGRGPNALEVRLRGGRRLLVRDFFRRDLLIELVATLEGLA